MSRSRTGVEHGDEVLSALEDLEEATTAEIAERAGVTEVAALVAAGKLGKAELIILIESSKPSRGNPRWRMPDSGAQGSM